jgi:hypothetical protein
MHAAVVVKACLLDTVQDGLLLSGATNNPTTTTNRTTEVLRRHLTALQLRTISIRAIRSTATTDITDSKVASSFNPRRTLMLDNPVASRSMKHHKAHHRAREDMGMESSDNLQDTGHNRYLGLV